MRIAIDTVLCKGHGQCAAIAPQVFAMGSEDRGHVVATDVGAGEAEAVEDAIVMCPEGAVGWVADGE